MTGKTHRVGGMLSCLGGYALLKDSGMLLSDVSPLLQLTVMYPFAIYGSTVSDLDHHWQSSPSKDIVSFGINKALHLSTKVRSRLNNRSVLYKSLGLFDAKHRSWQTHSDLFLLIMVFISFILLSGGVTSADQVLIRLVSMGLILGIISHLLLDMLTPEGVWSVFLTTLSKLTDSRMIPHKIHFVPNKEFFRTGGPWENLVRSAMWVGCVLLVLWIIYLECPYTIDILKA